MGRLLATGIATAVLAMTTTVGATAASAATPAATGTSVREAIARLSVAEERRAGYDRRLFRHWIDIDKDGCSSRAEAMLEEALRPPEIGPRCALHGGAWYSPYDNVQVAGTRGLDVDHVVPLAEAWDSGASAWSAQRRTDYANDLTDPRSLIVVTARSNRSKSDQDPSTWWPPSLPYRCTYLEDWVAVKTRWSLKVDPAEKDVLREQSERCPNSPIVVEIVPPAADQPLS